jgi:hypothetical protein
MLLALVVAAGVRWLRAEPPTVTVDSLESLRPYLTRDAVKVRLKPGTYRLAGATSPNFLEFTGRASHFDFTGVKIEVDTAHFTPFKKAGLNLIMLSGDGIIIEGLSLETVGNHPPLGGCRGIRIS